MTRLRFYLKDKSKMDEEKIKNLSEIAGINWHEDQLQIIAGNYVNDMYEELKKLGVPTDDAVVKDTEKKEHFQK